MVDDKDKYLEQLQAEGEPSEEVVDIDANLEGVGLTPDPDSSLNVLNSAEQLDKNAKND